jgi:hypothetical protein
VVDLNALSAKLMRAEMMGNTALVAELQAQLAAAQQQQQPQQVQQSNVQLLMGTARDGSAAPFVCCSCWCALVGGRMSFMLTSRVRVSAVPRLEGTAQPQRQRQQEIAHKVQDRQPH